MRSEEASGAASAKRAFYADAAHARAFAQDNWLGPTGRAIHAAECAILDRLIPRSTDEGLAIDVGCGNGRMLPELRRYGYRPVGLDLSVTMLALGPEDERLLAVAESAHLPLTDGSALGVLAHRHIYHLPRPQVVLAEFARVLRPAGWLCFDFIRWSPGSVLPSIAGVRARAVALHRPSDIVGALGAAGFRIHRSIDAFALNPTWVRGLPPGVARALLRPDRFRRFIPRVKTYVLAVRTAP